MFTFGLLVGYVLFGVSLYVLTRPKVVTWLKNKAMNKKKDEGNKK